VDEEVEHQVGRPWWSDGPARGISPCRPRTRVAVAMR
jgi:hypothetical protein